MRCHLCNILRHLSTGASQARAFEENYFPPRRERIGNRRIPIIECPREVLKEQQRETESLSKAAVRIFLFFCFNESRRSCDIACSWHVLSPLFPDQLLAAVNIDRCSGDRCVRHEVDRERSNVRWANDAFDR